MMDKKYRLTENKKQNGNATLYQIEALKDFDNVKKGGLGGAERLNSAKGV